MQLWGRLRNGLAAIVALVAILAPAATPAAIAPKTVVQFGHVSPVDVAVWLPGNRYVVSADAFDSSIIIWDLAAPASKQIIDHLRIPPLDAEGLFDAKNVRNMRFQWDQSQDGGTVVFDVDAAGPDDANHPVPDRRFSFALDIKTRTVTPVGTPQPISSKVIDAEDEDAALVPLPASPDGAYKLARQGNALLVTGADGRPAQMRGADGATATMPLLAGVEHGYYYDADLSPSGTLLARLVHLGTGNAGTSRVVVWDSRNGNGWVPYNQPGRQWNKVRWLGNFRYLLSGGGSYGDIAETAKLPVQVIDAASSRKIGEVPAQCLSTPVGTAGLFVGAGPSSCGAPSSASDGLWLFMPRNKVNGFSLDRAWKQIDVPQLKGQVITAITAHYDSEIKSWLIVAATRPEKPVRGVYPISVLAVVTDPIVKAEFSPLVSAKDLAGYDAENSIVQKLTYSSDGKLLLLHLVGGIYAVDMVGKKDPLEISTWTDDPEMVASDGATILVGGRYYKTLQRFDTAAGKRLLPPIQVSGVINGGYMVGKPIFWAASDDGALRFWDSRTGAKLLTYFSFAGDRYFATTLDGRYDTNLGADTSSVRWLMPDAKFRSLPLQTYMRDYFEPGLMQRLIDCTTANSCATAFKPVRPIADLNRVLPVVRITDVHGAPETGMIDVDVEVSEGVDATGVGAHARSGAYDLRLFRDGHLVTQFPAASTAAGWSDDVAAWRAATIVPGIDKGMVHQRFRIQAPSPFDNKPVSVKLTAYAFNSDRVKGESATLAATLWTDYKPRDVDFRAYVIAIGINSYSIPGKSLRYAVPDAEAYAKALGDLPDYASHVVKLTSEPGRNQATKAILHAVFGILGGVDVAANRKLLAAAGVDEKQLDPVNPDDVVFIAYSGHGYTDPRGNFYLLPSDAMAPDPANPATLASMVSAAELSDWLRPIDSDEFAMVIDACHSAASIATTGFKPGPLGDPGLGQLAFDKGMRILAATQGDDVALEDDELGHGLLTYVLVREGLAGKARLNKAGRVSMSALLGYGYVRLPALGRERARARAAAEEAAESSSMLVDATPRAVSPAKVQQPSLFNFIVTESNVDIPVGPQK